MAAPTPQYVRDLSVTGEFAALTDAQITNVVERVVLNYKSMTAEDLYLPVVGLHTAHLLYKLLFGPQGGGNNGQGPKTRVKVDKLEKQWAGPNNAQVVVGSGLDDTTPYGQECLRLLRGRLPAMRAAT